MTKVKICGLSTIQDIEAVNELLPNYVGFVFAKSIRQINQVTAKKLKKNLDERIKAVGVFVNDDIDNIVSICEENIIDIVQIHGDEDESYLKELKGKTNKPVIRAFRIKSVDDILLAQNSCADYILLDSFIKGSYGGSGHSFPWEMAKNLTREYFLAGGLHAGNIQEAVKTCQPYCVDVSSGVEINGKKDKDKIRAILAVIKKSQDRHLG